MIKNVPAYALGYPYFVAREVNGELWFWGAYRNQWNAADAAEEIGGRVCKAEEYLILLA